MKHHIVIAATFDRYVEVRTPGEAMTLALDSFYDATVGAGFPSAMTGATFGDGPARDKIEDAILENSQAGAMQAE